MSLYINSNAQVIVEMIHRLGLPGSVYDYVIDRKARTITSDVSGLSWPIADEMNLS